MAEFSGTVTPLHRLARLVGPDLSRAATPHLAWLDSDRTHGRHAALTCRYVGISRQTVYRWQRRVDPRDLYDARAPLPSAAPGAPADLDARVGADRVAAAPAGSPRGHRHAGRAAPTRGPAGFDLEGRVEPGPAQGARELARAPAPSDRPAPPPAAPARRDPPADGRSRAAAGRSRPGRSAGRPAAAGAGVHALHGPRCALALGCPRAPHAGDGRERPGRPRHAPGAEALCAPGAAGRRGPRVRRRRRAGVSSAAAAPVRPAAPLAQAHRQCRAGPAHAHRGVLRGPRCRADGARAESGAAELGADRQYGATPPSPRLSDAAGVRPAMAATPATKVSLIYWTSTSDCMGLVLALQ